MPVSSLGDDQATSANCLFSFSSRFARMGPGGEVPWRRARDRGDLERLLSLLNFCLYVCFYWTFTEKKLIIIEQAAMPLIDTDDPHGGTRK